jgi:hypothetical protein
MALGKTPDAITELDDVTQYIFHNYYRLLTDDEGFAWKLSIARAKDEASHDKGHPHLLADKLGAQNKEVIALLADGVERFFVTVRDRILQEYKAEIVLSYCPRCGALTRTPKSKICPKCSFSWHETSAKS